MKQQKNLLGLTIAEARRHVDLDPLEVRILLCHGLGLSRTQLITQSDRIISEEESRHLANLFQRRSAGEPIAYVTGEREFYGLSFRVSPAVLIPRPETEMLVDLGIARLPEAGSVLDMGTGSGAIAVAIAYTRPDATVSAIDISQDALQVAHENADRLLTKAGKPVRFLAGSWFDALGKDERFDLIVANPPYIPVCDAHLSQGDLRFEPSGALTDGADGLSALSAIVSGASLHLLTGGWLLLEHGYDQAEKVHNLLKNKGFSPVQQWQDLAGIVRVSGGRMLE